MPKILSNTTVGNQPTPYYGTLITGEIKYADGPVTVQKVLHVRFLAPPKTSKIELVPGLNPWQAVSTEIGLEPHETNTKVTADVTFPASYTFNASDILTWDVSDGDLTGDASEYTDSFELYVDDEFPNGTVEIQISDAPDSALSDSTQTVTLTDAAGIKKSYSATPGETITATVWEGQYTITASELANANETVVSATSVYPTNITVEVDGTSRVTVDYEPVQRYSALDVTVGGLSEPLSEEALFVKVTADDGDTRTFFSGTNHTTHLRRLPPAGRAIISSELTVNNTKYTSLQSANLSNTLISVSIGDSDIDSTDVTDPTFVELPISIQTGELPPDANNTFTLRLASADSTVIYVDHIAATSGTTKLGWPVKPDTYTVNARGFIEDGILYDAQAASEITVAADGSSSLSVSVVEALVLRVRGFPDYLSFGALTNLVDTTGKDLTAARVSSIFAYAGFDGAGDADRYLDDDTQTTATVKLAAQVSENLNGQPVLPVMVNYTINLSLGDNETHLQNAEWLEHSFGNFILSMQIARRESSSEVSAGFIVNPDFLGANQQDKRQPTYAMPVAAPLRAALATRKVDATVPDTITETLAGYVLAVNWLVRTVAPDATFGWQINLWGVGAGEWIYEADEGVPADKAKLTVDYIQSLGAYSGDYVPDFLAIDRYEADDFTVRAYGNGYCYAPRQWRRYYQFVQAVALNLKIPVMPWQIPASRIPSVSEDVKVENLEADHWGTGGTYIFGDPAIGSEVSNINGTILDIALTVPTLIPYDSVDALFRASEPFDLTKPAYPDFPFFGIFTVLLGGGSTTGVVTGIGSTGVWTQQQISKYMDDPISFDSVH
ncbi:putative carbohydrate binding domain protein [Rosellinia necatrix]|uniref:Putative carbohydrate binding domain protein n=1 Tax=Rosellinia necatrix TaxID=77044 RepID=A0A1S7UJ87_ROSNE|nr:putative carbohydrate binding domain protein [Rosellinia necatrix]